MHVRTKDQAGYSSPQLGTEAVLTSRRLTQHGEGSAQRPESRMRGRINLAHVSGENIDLKCSAVF
jgi:hypothetical protein